jgi:hypothetical protein
MYVEENKNEHSYCLPRNVPSWIRHLSFGGLIQPLEEFLEHVQLMEKIFFSLPVRNVAYMATWIPHLR